MARYLGIDYGTKRIGVAVSDENGFFAFPREIISNNKEVLGKIIEITKKEKIEAIVIGDSADFKGKPNTLSSKVDLFISKLKEISDLSIYKQKEFLTSVEARRSKETKKDSNKTQAHSKIKKAKSGRVDAGAAALILQRYLDKINKSR